ncbi:MAG: hypothetical protein ACYDAO_02485 [Thermoplasmataceae archaeon]
MCKAEDLLNLIREEINKRDSQVVNDEEALDRIEKILDAGEV